MEEEFKKFIKEFLVDSLDIEVVTEKYYGDYGSNEGVKVSVKLYLDGELLTSSQDYTSL